MRVYEGVWCNFLFYGFTWQQNDFLHVGYSDFDLADKVCSNTTLLHYLFLENLKG